MPRLPNITFRTVIAFLRASGFVEDHATGSHFVFFNSALKRRAVVPRHPRGLPKGTLFAILREAGFRREDLLSFLKRR